MTRLEAIALRLEAIATNLLFRSLGHFPSMPGRPNSAQQIMWIGSVEHHSAILVAPKRGAPCEPDMEERAALRVSPNAV